MSNQDQEPATKRPRLSAEDTNALWWLARWFGIPFAIIVALFYAEPLFRRAQVEVVPAVAHQEVHPYPFNGSAPPTSLAPPPVIRAPAPAPSDLSGADIVAHPIAQPQPTYPQRALEAEKEGTVHLRLTIAPDGSVTDAVVTSASPSGWFESAATGAVKQWRYQPPGRTLQTDAEIEFKLK